MDVPAAVTWFSLTGEKGKILLVYLYEVFKPKTKTVLADLLKMGTDFLPKTCNVNHVSSFVNRFYLFFPIYSTDVCQSPLAQQFFERPGPMTFGPGI
jgi:hypothetical protein